MQNFLHDKTVVGSPLKHFSVLSLILFLFWMLLSGKFESKFIIYGIVSSLAAAWICMPLLLLDNTSHTKKYFAFDIPLFSYMLYWLWLLKEVVLANIAVVRATIKADMDIAPQVVRFHMPMDNPMAHTTLANSITLTPGTVTLNVTPDGYYEVHALTADAAADLCSGSMQRKVAELFGEKFEFTIELQEGEK